MAMVKRALAPFGKEVHGLDLSLMAGTSFDEIAALVARSRVVVFRDQQIDDAAFVQFLSGLGELTFTEGETPAEHAQDLNVVSNVGRRTPPKSVFHTDTSYVARPPSFTALRPVLLPASGGDTLFSNQVRAAASLPDHMRQYLTGKTIMHGVTGLEGQSATIRQPVLRRHPITAETSLYLSTPQRCTQLSGADEKASESIVAELYRHSIEPDAIYRHHWKAGDVLIWDNRVTMHRADHGDVTQDRVLHRGMVMGEVPVMA